MSKAIIQEIKKRMDQAKKEDPQYEELDLSEIKIGEFTPEINALLEKNKNLEIIYLVDCGLTTLEGLPKGKYIGFDFSKNKLNDNSHFEALIKYENLSQLIFSENNVEKLETVLILSEIRHLNELDFEGNPVASLPNYRQAIFEKFEVLELLDRKDKEGNLHQQEYEGDQFLEDDEEEQKEQQYQEDDDKKQKQSSLSLHKKSIYEKKDQKLEQGTNQNIYQQNDVIIPPKEDPPNKTGSKLRK